MSIDENTFVWKPDLFYFKYLYVAIIITIFPWLSDAINLDSIFLVKEETGSH